MNKAKYLQGPTPAEQLILTLANFAHHKDIIIFLEEVSEKLALHSYKLRELGFSNTARQWENCSLMLKEEIKQQKDFIEWKINFKQNLENYIKKELNLL
jgi:hypothetical protein